MSSASIPPFANAWLAQWRRAGAALAELQTRELRALHATKALAVSEALLSMVDPRAFVHC
ncbi:MAG: hypothetical protein IPK60_14715 [Sandaracinaceae bacterium]|nr:hypothetical protein [Sandaracinaceae bacterium]